MCGGSANSRCLPSDGERRQRTTRPRRGRRRASGLARGRDAGAPRRRLERRCRARCRRDDDQDVPGRGAPRAAVADASPRSTACTSSTVARARQRAAVAEPEAGADPRAEPSKSGYAARSAASSASVRWLTHSRSSRQPAAPRRRRRPSSDLGRSVGRQRARSSGRWKATPSTAYAGRPAADRRQLADLGGHAVAAHRRSAARARPGAPASGGAASSRPATVWITRAGRARRRPGRRRAPRGQHQQVAGERARALRPARRSVPTARVSTPSHSASRASRPRPKP